MDSGSPSEQKLQYYEDLPEEQRMTLPTMEQRKSIKELLKMTDEQYDAVIENCKKHYGRTYYDPML